MNLKYIITVIVTMFCVLNANAENIKMFGKEDFGYDVPQYKRYREYNNVVNLNVISDPDNFPISSQLQGSVFEGVFEELVNRYNLYIRFIYSDNYNQKAEEFEKNKRINVGEFSIHGHIGVVYGDYPYSNNEYIYPSFFDDSLHMITSADNKLEIKTKDDLKKYKGIYVKRGQKSSKILKDFSVLRIEPIDTYNKAFELLLTGKVDYIIGSYYGSQIEAYKLGLRNYLIYSKTALWKNPLFIRVAPNVYNSKYADVLKRYLRSSKYKEARDASLKRVLEIYKENTQGVVPVMYINDNNADK